MGISQADTGDLRRSAEAVLRGNDAGAWTKPSATQYPHQWNWDSAFISLGLACFDWDRATVEIESMLGARWREGMVPHVRYDSRHLADYFPGPDWWPRAQAHVEAADVLTSGISNPPVIVSAALRVGRRQPDASLRHGFWRRVLPALAEYLDWFRSRRRLPGSELFVSVHPWETGWDNSPRWDHLAGLGLRPQRPYVRLDTVHIAAGQRPGDKDYDAYLRLAELLDEADYDLGAYLRTSPMAVNDVLLDALWYRAAVDLGEMAAEIGSAAPISAEVLSAFRAEFEAVHWDEESETYLDRDLKSGNRIRTATAAGLAAMVAGLAGRSRAEAMWRTQLEHSGNAAQVPSVRPDQPMYEPGRYWRGPVWVNVNWLVADGLERCGLAAASDLLRRQTLGLVSRQGFHEYFDPRTGAGLGSDSFSWTAALTLDLITP